MNRLQWRIHARGWARATLYLVVLAAFALRAYHLGMPAIWWDESLSVYRATRDLAAILSNIIYIQNVVTYDTLPPLYFVCLHFCVALFGTSEFALRYFSLMANVATIPLVYALARRWFSSSPVVPGRAGAGVSVGVVAAFLTALAPFNVWYAQEARPYALVLFLSTLAVYALTRVFVIARLSEEATLPSVARGDKRGWLLIYVLSAAGALYTHYYAIFLIPFHVVLIALYVWRSPRARVWILLPALPLVFAVFLVPLVTASLAGNAGAGPYFVPLDIILRDLLNSFSVGITMDAARAVWFDVAMLALFVVGIAGWGMGDRKASRRDWKFGISILAYIFVPVIGVFAASYVRPLYQNSRYFIAISPAFYLGAAAGVVALARRWKWLALPALGVFLAGAVISLNNLYFDPAFGKDDHRAWAEYLQEHVQPGDFLILDSPHTEELFQYYARDRVPWMSLPLKTAPSPEQDRAAVREAYQKNTRVWFLAMNVAFDDPDAHVERMLNENGVLIDRVNFTATSTELALSLFVPALPVADASHIPHLLNIEFAGNLRLRGYDAPRTITAGERGSVELFWQVDAPVGEDYAVSLRAADEAGHIVAQWDHAPLGNRAGTTTWKPGLVLADAHDLPIPAKTPPGVYRLQVVPYHPATGAALGDVVTLGEISITGIQ